MPNRHGEKIVNCHQCDTPIKHGTSYVNARIPADLQHGDVISRGRFLFCSWECWGKYMGEKRDPQRKDVE